MSIYKQLYPFQKNIVDKFKHRENFGLFLDMGLGKTPTSLALAEVNFCTKILIISINGKAIESVDENGSWLWWTKQSDIPYVLLDKWSTIDKFIDSKNLPQTFIINYESLFVRKTKKIILNDNILTFLNSCKGERVAIIIDESHKVKNLQSMQTKAITRIVRTLKVYAKHLNLYLCTGTPFTKGYIDLYSQLKLLGYPETKGTFMDDFCIRGNLPGLLGWQQPIVGYKNINDLFNLVHKYAITILSEDVTILPEKIFIDVPQNINDTFKMFTTEKVTGKNILNFANKKDILLNDTDKSKYNVPIKTFNPFYRNIDYPSLDFFADTSGVFWLRARQLSVGFIGNANNAIWFDRTRLFAFEKFLENNEDNYLIFYNYTPELLELYEICEKLGYNIDVYCGEVKSLVFYNQYEKLSESEKLVNKKNVIIANYASGSTGLNWQLYNKCIEFSTPLYKDFAQGHKRIHRLGQKADRVVYYRFYQRNWLDEGMRMALNSGIEYNEDLFKADLERINKLKDED